jgi:ribosomal protein S18 acetylase RimI-like enzyme
VKRQAFAVRILNRSELREATILKRAALVDAFTPHVPKLHRLFQWRNRKALKATWLFGATIGAFKNGEMIGVAAYTPRGSKFFDKISDLWVSQAHRSAGVGAILLRNAEMALRRQGVRVARLTTPKFNSSAVRFYQTHGWRVERLTLHRTLYYTVIRFKKRLSG